MAQPQAQAEGRSEGRGRVLLLLLLLLGHLCVTGTSRSLSCRSQSASLTNSQDRCAVWPPQASGIPGPGPQFLGPLPLTLPSPLTWGPSPGLLVASESREVRTPGH